MMNHGDERQAIVRHLTGVAMMQHLLAKTVFHNYVVCTHSWWDVFLAQDRWVIMTRCPKTKEVFVSVQDGS